MINLPEPVSEGQIDEMFYAADMNQEMALIWTTVDKANIYFLKHT